MPVPTRRAFGFAGCIALGFIPAIVALGAETAGVATSPRSRAQKPLVWVEQSSRTMLARPGARWTLHLEAAETGTADSEGRKIPIRQTRVRVTSDDAVGAQAQAAPEVATIQHLDNLEIAVLPPDDRRLSAPPEPRQGATPWPNPCGFHFIDLPSGFDIDQDDRNDFALRAYTTIDDPRANRILFFDENDEGRPEPIDPSTFVGTLRAEALVLVDVQAAKPYPIVQARYEPLEGCRFLAQLGIRGAPVCDDCCAMPVFLHRLEDGRYHPTYDRTVQQPLLERLRQDLEVVANGDSLGSLTSAEQAALARAAAFFYLTGQGPRTRGQLELALAARANDYRAQLLLDRIERYFLADPPDGRPAEQPEPGNGSESGEKLGGPAQAAGSSGSFPAAADSAAIRRNPPDAAKD